MRANDVINWLSKGDPSVRYQVLRDITGSSQFEVKEAQARIAMEGWGHRLLQVQQENGMWSGGLYSPKWISTHYTLLTLKQLGLPHENPQAQKAAQLLLASGYFHDGGINFFASLDHSETCVTGMVLSMVSWFRLNDSRLHHLAEYLMDQQMPDGGWNCRSYMGDRHSSFHTTICVLEGLHEYERYLGRGIQPIREARAKAHEFLLQHHLFRSDKTGKVVDERMTRFSFPPRWRYDVMRALDYFSLIHHPHDPRFCDAIQILRKKEKNGRWPMQARHSGLDFFVLEKAGSPSRINTVRAMRILKWWRDRAGKTMDCQ